MAIIGLLIGIALPALSHARESGQNVKCLSNLRQVQIGLTTYLPDNRNQLPYVLPLSSGGNNEEEDESLLAQLRKYLSHTDVFICPADDTGVAEALGSSYDYWPGWIMFAREVFRGDDRKTVARTVTVFYDMTPGRWPVMADADAWHRSVNTSTGKNASYWDGSAGALVDWTDPTWRDRLGG